MTYQPKLSKIIARFFLDLLKRILVTLLKQVLSQSNWNIADVKPVFKKDSRTDKKNYRPISIITNVSKICERCINKQLEEYFQALLSKYQCGFRKGYSVINALLPMFEKWRKSLDAGGAFGALLIAKLPSSYYC